MGTVARLLAEHVSFRCTSVDRVGVRGYVPGLQYEVGVVKFLLNRGNDPLSGRVEPQPRAAGRRARGTRGQRPAVPVVRFKAGAVQRGPGAPLPRRRHGNRSPGTGAGRQGPGADLGVAGLVDDTHAGPSTQPSSHGLAPPVLGARPLVLLLRRPRVGTGLRQDLHLRALPTVVLRQRTRVGQVPAGQGRDRLRGARQRPAHRARIPRRPIASVPVSAPVTCARSWPA